jgi:outer membrane protein OmpA-like peptidoglycan-associated protein
MAGSSSEEDNIPWSGFIDILSSVIMVFIFFMMLTVIVISQSTKKKKVADNQTKEEVTYTENRTEKSIIQKTIVDDTLDTKKQFYVVYQDTGITLLDDSLNKISQYFNFNADNTDYKDKKIFIASYAPLYINATTKQEIALYRAFNVRNYLLQNGIIQKNINIKIYSDISENKEKNIECRESILGCVLISHDK